ncbi:MAG: hypothetical protein GY874_04390 [Desulfobacteraceae bacterium]|nr:hypothetical protein [Desulfobacteraceae bacterium]
MAHGTTHDTAHGTAHGTTHEHIKERAHSSSRSFYNNKPTTNTPTHNKEDEIKNNIAEILETDPELGFFRNKKLKPQQVLSWMTELHISLDDMIESLRHYRFYLVDMKKEEKIEDLFDYFYKVLKKAGYYKPANSYKSFTQKQIDRELARAERLKAETQQLAHIREKADEAEFELMFEKMLSDPDGQLFKACFEKLTPYAKSRRNKPGDAFYNPMREALKSHLGHLESNADVSN